MRQQRRRARPTLGWCRHAMMVAVVVLLRQRSGSAQNSSGGGSPCHGWRCGDAHARRVNAPTAAAAAARWVVPHRYSAGTTNEQQPRETWTLQPGRQFWFAFSVYAQEVWVVSTQPGTLADTALALFDETSPVCADDDNGFLLGASCTFVAQRNSTIYGRVTSYSRWGQSGTFTVTIDAVTMGAGPSPCASITDCSSANTCAREFYRIIETCPPRQSQSISDLRFACSAGCATSLIPFYFGAPQSCRWLVSHLSDFAPVSTVNNCDVSTFGSKDLAIAVQLGVAADGNIHTPGFREWFVFQTQALTTYRISTQLDAGCNICLGDSVLSVYRLVGAQARLLAKNDDFGGLSSGILWREDGNSSQVYLMVRAYLPAGTGSFRLQVLKESSSQGGGPACSSGGTFAPWRRILFLSGCQIHVVYEEAVSSEIVEAQLLKVEGQDVQHLLQLARATCSPARMVEIFAENFDFVASLAGVTTNSTMRLQVRLPDRTILEPLVTNTANNRRRVRGQWRGDFDARQFSAAHCPRFSSEFIFDGWGHVSKASFQSAVSQIAGVGIDRLEIMYYWQEVRQNWTSPLVLPNATDYVRLGVSSLLVISPESVSLRTVQGGSRRQLQSRGTTMEWRARADKDLAANVGADFWHIRLANSINQASAGALPRLTQRNFIVALPQFRTKVVFRVGRSTQDNLGAILRSQTLTALNMDASTNIFSASVVSAAPNGVNPQCSRYLFSASDFNTAFHRGMEQRGNAIELGDEQVSDSISLDAVGVIFFFYGRRVTNLLVSSNGFVYLRDTVENPLLMSAGQNAGDLPQPSYGALISPYWEDLDPAGLHCGNPAGSVRWGLVDNGIIVSFHNVKNCGSGGSSSWQLVLKNGTSSFDIVLEYAKGDKGTHTIGWQSWDGADSMTICYGEGRTKCWRQGVAYSVHPAIPAVQCHADAMCTATAGRTYATPRYSGCQCKPCYNGDGVTTCTNIEQCDTTATASDAQSESGSLRVVTTVFVGIVLVGLGGALLLVCQRISWCPFHRQTVPAVLPEDVYIVDAVVAAPASGAQEAQTDSQPGNVQGIVVASLNPVRPAVGGTLASFP